jgi:hypothetical protein
MNIVAFTDELSQTFVRAHNGVACDSVVVTEEPILDLEDFAAG